jgi:hypothetical protein
LTQGGRKIVERRGNERRPVDIKLTCRMPARPQKIVVHDISYDGCKLEVPGAMLELGGTTLLDVPGAGQVAGRIIWAHGRVGGVRFERRLGTPAAIALGLEQAQAEEAKATFAELSPQPAPRLPHWFRLLAACFS